jgi:hypothetical protein
LGLETVTPVAKTVHAVDYATTVNGNSNNKKKKKKKKKKDRLCGLVVRVLGYRSGGPGSIPGTTKKNSGSGTESTQTREYNRGAT